ncbi:MAG: hypothetical protein WCI03_10780 [bacterium]
MIVPVLCLVCFFFLCWILVLKIEVEHLKKELDRVQLILKKKMGYLHQEVKVEAGRSLKGREAEKGSLLRVP